MAYSSLISKEVRADSSNYTHSRNAKICKITPHHAACVSSAERIARAFQNPKRNCSANYCIGNNGTIVGSLPEECRPWTSSSSYNDNRAITIEVSNCERGGNWKISDAAWNSLVALCVDICKRYNFKLVYDGTSNGSLTRHNMFAKTACPGPYLQGRFAELASLVNSKLSGSTPKSTNATGRIANLQKALNEAGARLAIDNSYGPLTKKAVSKYWNSRSVIKWVQNRLNTLGYGRLAVDGSRGPATKAATKRYQRASRLQVDGSAGPTTIRYLATR